MLLLMPTAVAHEESIDCTAVGGCTLVPSHLIDEANEAIERLRREVLRLRAITGCA